MSDSDYCRSCFAVLILHNEKEHGICIGCASLGVIGDDDKQEHTD